ncbi:hypothetical protein P691DRAFT_782800 [Macrolepiota fuliginosa MF-IS2]|uniref:Uncharacterized protein n=1 Tax=Macrolepiota fuliginosa MF-IS2 TaxID=1400762 RepID=A0A9P5WZQ5_9AGAR|nr:hypothetical protein P691DRAFT_782800 [Macrolepiota fuliginosa MF-IS2]
MSEYQKLVHEKFQCLPLMCNAPMGDILRAAATTASEGMEFRGVLPVEERCGRKEGGWERGEIRFKGQGMKRRKVMVLGVRDDLWSRFSIMAKRGCMERLFHGSTTIRDQSWGQERKMIFQRWQTSRMSVGIWLKRKVKDFDEDFVGYFVDSIFTERPR